MMHSPPALFALHQTKDRILPNPKTLSSRPKV